MLSFICYITTAASINISSEIKWTNKYFSSLVSLGPNMTQTHKHILDPPAVFNQTVCTVNTH